MQKYRINRTIHKKIIEEIKEIGAQNIIKTFNLKPVFINRVKANKLIEKDLGIFEELRETEKYKEMYEEQRHISDDEMSEFLQIVSELGTKKKASLVLGFSENYLNTLIANDATRLRNGKYKELMGKINNFQLQGA